MINEEPVNILLVDDQPGKLLSYEVILDGLGERLFKAGSAREALEHLLKQDIAIILIDVCMPELDGYELAALIRDHPRFQTTAIIFVSAIALSDLDRLKGYEYGAVDYVPVPVVPELLRAKVRVFADLYRKTRQLELLNSELERRVEERTAELAQTNSELEQRVEERTREHAETLAQMHEMQKLESIGKLTGGVAHDFNNVLMAILGNLDMLLHRLAADSPLRRFVIGATQAADRGANLTKRLLAFARRQELKPAAVDMVLLVDSMGEMLRRSLGPIVQINLDFPEDLDLVRVDPNQLELAILNLALNARDAMPQGGALTIAAQDVGVAAGNAQGLEPGSYICLAVIDTGDGMDEETLRHAAEPFYTTKGLGKGTGLGLSMVYGLATQSGGTMRISSRLGAGTKVELWLPVTDEGEHRPLPPRIPDRIEPTPPCRILLVDDDQAVAEGTVAMLEHLGHEVVVAASADEALGIVTGTVPVDLVITDHAMPGMTGTEFIACLHQMMPDLPVVLATGYADIPRGTDPSVPRLDKPFRLENLAAAIAALMSERQGRVAAPTEATAADALLPRYSQA
jgi:signal transduction histidine kinase/ActR/RegA family two-component response regulator